MREQLQEVEAVANHPEKYFAWLKRVTDRVTIQNYETLRQQLHELRSPPLDAHDCCLFVLTEDEANRDDNLKASAGLLVTSGCPTMILILNERPLNTTAQFGEAVASHCVRLSSTALEVRYVPNTPMRRAIYSAMERSMLRGGKSGWRSPLQALALALATVPVALASYLYNLTVRTVSAPPRSGLCSSIFLIERPPNPPVCSYQPRQTGDGMEPTAFHAGVPEPE